MILSLICCHFKIKIASKLNLFTFQGQNCFKIYFLTFQVQNYFKTHFIYIQNTFSSFHSQSTCHLALDSCRDDRTCLSDLKSVIHDCDIDRCDKPSCMESLKTFYRNSSHEDLSLDAALCLCRKTSSRHDSCMLAKEKLHPVCAQRPPDSSSTAATEGGFNPLPACHTIADLCKEDPECRLEENIINLLKIINN